MEETASDTATSDRESQDDLDDSLTMFAIWSKTCKSIVQAIDINGVSADMDLDTGAAYSVITQRAYHKIAQRAGVT